MSAQYLVETDVLAEYLVAAPGERSLLREALRYSVCYTTMLNALELFRAARGIEGRAAVLQLLHLVRVLGFNFRTAETYAELAEEIEMKTGAVLTDRDLMVIGMARASKLAILTRSRYQCFRDTNSVEVFSEVSSVTIPASRDVSQTS